MNPLQRTRKLISDVLSSSQSRSNDIPPYSPSNTSSKIHKIRKRMGSSKGSRWIRRLCRISPRVTICSLPDEVLLDIFEFCLPDHWHLRAMAWPKFVHVCQRWRYIILASPLRLDLRLFCTDRTPVEEMLDVWPPLPLEIAYHSVDPQHFARWNKYTTTGEFSRSDRGTLSGTGISFSFSSYKRRDCAGASQYVLRWIRPTSTITRFEWNSISDITSISFVIQ
ncbi:hypothetical protein BGW80DRAFT_441975 [Lactifluus volemus]|nr:hypothetical protein BGW80DRAFT_441975 [Lactifluus volemus]